jgi:hypothetical protein
MALEGMTMGAADNGLAIKLDPCVFRSSAPMVGLGYASGPAFNARPPIALDPTRHAAPAMISARPRHACIRCSTQSENLPVTGGKDLLDSLPLFVDQRAYPTPDTATYQDVAHAQHGALHKRRRDLTTAPVELGLDHDARRVAGRVGSQLK